MRDITELPHDLFLLVIYYLSPRTCVLCRRVSRQWLAAFSDDAISLLLLRWNFPKCREMRLAAAVAATAASRSDSPETTAVCQRGLGVEATVFANHHRCPGQWAATFVDVARRYHHLRHARPWTVEKLDLAVNQVNQGGGSVFSFTGVATWNRFLRLEEKTANFHYPDPTWWYSQDDGVVVFPAEDMRATAERSDGHVYQVLDLHTNRRVPVPFDTRQKHIRRVRLAQGVLIFEWAEALPYHQLNDREVVHRHFVTAFDVVRTLSAANDSPPWNWSVEFRSEWKLHFLGLPLNRSDRFFSAHTASHYAVYFWQPNRSLYQDDPIEQLAVWDISSPSPYRPSEDPKGGKRPTRCRAQTTPNGLWSGQNIAASTTASASAESVVAGENTFGHSSLAAATAGPQVIRRMAWRDLDFYGLRQRATPQLRNLTLDGRNLYVIEEEHRWADGQHTSLNPPRLHLVRCTGIPIIPEPSPTSTTSNSRTDPTTVIISGPVHGPVWVDECGADGDVTMCFCRRLSPHSNTTGSPEHQTHTQRPTIADASTADAAIDSLVTAPRPQDPLSSWPWGVGRAECYAACWRHEEFPYLTVAEVLDADAGVRVTARHCFMLETLSVRVRPAMITVNGPATAADDDGEGDQGASNKMKTRSGRRSSSRATSSGTKSIGEQPTAQRSGEVQFLDSMWAELMARGYIAGDERWILGEDEKGRVTVLRF